MNITDVLENIEKLRGNLSSDFEELELNLILPPERALIKKDGEDLKSSPVPFRGDGIGDKSGIYFLLSESGEILYIGKATTNNIHERIWDHLKTPARRDNGEKFFPKNHFQNRRLDRPTVSKVTNGEIRLAAIEVKPSYFSSLIEVYLHTMNYKKDGRIPLLNKQIG